MPLVQDVVDSHPGLGFLKEATEFHSRYVHTVRLYMLYLLSAPIENLAHLQVIARIFYCVNRSWSGRITIPELRKSNFLAVLSTLDEEEDINQVTDFFSYEHFYVIYCKFWELDKDHDLFIDREDLSRHNDHGEGYAPVQLKAEMIQRGITDFCFELHFPFDSHLDEDDRSHILWRGDARRHAEGGQDVLHRVRVVPHRRGGQAAPHRHRVLVRSHA